MGRSKNLMIEVYPDDVEMPDDFDEWSASFDSFMKNRQADEPGIHQPVEVKSHSLLTEF